MLLIQFRDTHRTFILIANPDLMKLLPIASQKKISLVPLKFYLLMKRTLSRLHLNLAQKIDSIIRERCASAIMAIGRSGIVFSAACKTATHLAVVWSIQLAEKFAQCRIPVMDA